MRAVRVTFPDRGLTPYGGDPGVLADLLFLPEDRARGERRVRERPRVERRGDGWRVRAWMVQPAAPNAGVWRVECTFTGAGRAGLRMLDSIPGTVPVL